MIVHFIKEGSLFTARYELAICVYAEPCQFISFIGYIGNGESFLVLETTKLDPGSNKFIKILKGDIIGYVFQWQLGDLKEINLNLEWINI